MQNTLNKEQDMNHDQEIRRSNFVTSHSWSMLEAVGAKYQLKPYELCDSD